MNMIVSSRARAQARAVTADMRNGVVAPQSIAPSTFAAAPARRGALRARWFPDPVSGRLECRWTTDDDVPDSWHAAHSTTVGELGGTFVERLAA